MALTPEQKALKLTRRMLSNTTFNWRKEAEEIVAEANQKEKIDEARTIYMKHWPGLEKEISEGMHDDAKVMQAILEALNK